MNHDKLERQNLLNHLSGELRKGFPRKVMNEEIVKHAIKEKIMLNQTWIIKMELPDDMSIDCDKASAWIQTRIHDFVGEGFLHVGTEAAIKETKVDEKKQDVPFWFIHVLHPQYKDPRTCVKKCVAYEQKVY